MARTCKCTQRSNRTKKSVKNRAHGRRLAAKRNKRRHLKSAGNK